MKIPYWIKWLIGGMVVGPVFQYIYFCLAALMSPVGYLLFLATYPLQKILWELRSTISSLAELSLAAVYFGVMSVLLGLILRLLTKRRTGS